MTMPTLMRKFIGTAKNLAISTLLFTLVIGTSSCALYRSSDRDDFNNHANNHPNGSTQNSPSENPNTEDTSNADALRACQAWITPNEAIRILNIDDLVYRATFISSSSSSSSSAPSGTLHECEVSGQSHGLSAAMTILHCYLSDDPKRPAADQPLDFRESNPSLTLAEKPYFHQVLAGKRIQFMETASRFLFCTLTQEKMAATHLGQKNTPLDQSLEQTHELAILLVNQISSRLLAHE